MLREAAKTSSLFSGRPLREGGEVKAAPLEKNNFFRTLVAGPVKK